MTAIFLALLTFGSLMVSNPVHAADTAPLESDLWKIETNLPNDHPCVRAGYDGTWNGWCMFKTWRGAMHLMTFRNVSPKKDPLFRCINIVMRIDRRRCYRTDRVKYWTRNFFQTPIINVRRGLRNLWNYL